MEIAPIDDYKCRYFIPEESDDWKLTRFGMFANDLGYDETINTIEEYTDKSIEKNMLQIVWRLELSEGVLRPSWPVVIVAKDVRFTNKVPMEVGIHYSWRYWLAARLIKESTEE
jgi:hypothetical protein